MAVTWAIIIVVSLRTYTDPDLWGHLRFGLDAIAAGDVIRVDPYSYLNLDHPWINHEWLMEVLMGLAWRVGGEVGLITLRFVVYLATLGLIFWWLVKVKQTTFIPTVIIWLGVVMTTIWFSLVVRPQIFTFFLFAVMLMIIEAAERGQYRWLWLTPVVVGGWVNLHGGFLAGCGMLGVWTIAHVALNRTRWRAIIPPVVCAALATLVNPYGLGILSFLFETATGDRPEIADWQPLPIRSPFGAIYLVVMALAVWGVYRSSLQRRPILIGLFGLVGIMPLVAIRHLPLMGIAFAIFTGEHVNVVWESFFRRQQTEVAIPRWLRPIPIVAAALILASGLIISPWRFIPVTSVPYNATVLLRESGFRGNLMCDFGWGQYLIWHLGPLVKVGMDGRRETVYASDVYAEYINFHFGTGDWEAILRRQPTDAVLVGFGSPPANLLTIHPDWRLVFTDHESALFIRTDSTAAAVIEQTARTFTPREVASAFP
ncbi:hypothetical protein [Chloroflexus sp.]|uniref:hypothetical protein n=1 Tax=Chloroflexus sp. TaxID=1904827 RepID=UPI003C72B53D